MPNCLDGCKVKRPSFRAYPKKMKWPNWNQLRYRYYWLSYARFQHNEHQRGVSLTQPNSTVKKRKRKKGGKRKGEKKGEGKRKGEKKGGELLIKRECLSRPTASKAEGPLRVRPRRGRGRSGPEVAASGWKKFCDMSQSIKAPLAMCEAILNHGLLLF